MDQQRTHDRPRLLVAASTFPSRRGDGTPGFVLDLAEAVASEFRVLVVAPMVEGAARHEWIGDVEVRRYRYFPRRWQDLAEGAIVDNLRADRTRWLQVPFFFGALAGALLRARLQHRPQVAHLHWIIPQGLVGALVLGSVPRVITTLGGDLYALRHPVLQRLKSRVVAGARYVTCMSGDMASELARLGADPERVRVVPMGVDVDPLRRAGEREDRLADRVLFVGRLVEKKGAAVFLDAVRELPAADGVVVGSGPLRSALEAAAPSTVSFVGALGREDLATQYARAAIAVHPSVPAASGDRDGLPVALLEAMSSGCAIVASRVPGIVDVVEDGVSGILVPPGDAAALREAIRSLLEDESLRTRLGEAARRTAEAYSVEAISATYRDLLRETAAG